MIFPIPWQACADYHLCGCQPLPILLTHSTGYNWYAFPASD